MRIEIRKYPSTPHLKGSRLQAGDDASGQVSLSSLRAAFPGAVWVIEEKLDGANSGISYDPVTLDQMLQCRGHYLSGGAREFQFAEMKPWASALSGRLLNVLEDRYVMYGEWTYALHTHFYDELPHHFHEFDVWDRVTDRFLDTERRRELLSGLPIVSVPVLHAGDAPRDVEEVRSMIVRSRYRSEGWRDRLVESSERSGIGRDDALARAGSDEVMEGVYGKLEIDGEVVFRWKFVTERFVQTSLDRGDEWSSRTMIRNLLADGRGLMDGVFKEDMA